MGSSRGRRRVRPARAHLGGILTSAGRQQRRVLRVRSTSSPEESTMRCGAVPSTAGRGELWTGLGGILTSALPARGVARSGHARCVRGWHRPSHSGTAISTATTGADGPPSAGSSSDLPQPRCPGAPGTLAVFAASPRTTPCGPGVFDGVSSNDWVGLGGILSTAPGAASRSHGTYVTCSRGGPTRCAVWRRRRDDDGGHWGDWNSLGGLITSPPAAVSPDPGAVNVFARGIDDALWVSNDGGGGVRWWSSLGGVLR